MGKQRKFLKRSLNYRRKLNRLVDKTVPQQPGLYALLTPQGNPLYIGRAERSIRDRIKQHFDPSHSRHKLAKNILATLHAYDYLVVPEKDRSVDIERNLIRKYKPPFNRTL